MIDDYAKAKELMHKMEAQLPIPARPTGAFVRALQEEGVKIPRDQQLQTRHPLAKEIHEYQQERTRRIALSGESSQPSQLTVRPRKRRRLRR